MRPPFGTAGDATAQPDEQALRDIVRQTPWLMHALRIARSLGLASWCIGAGALRNAVWDHLHGYPAPSRLADIDLAYFDPENLTQQQDDALLATLQSMAPDLPWEVTNQAAVHLWFGSHFGYAVEPLRSLAEAIATWPEYATAVGIYLDDADRLRIIAPHGLQDLLQMRIRHNPVRASAETYRQRTLQKRYQERWPDVVVDAAPSTPPTP
ncbi:nucleotidyltransferase family protein [Chromobacterium amazonense]|uniref:nucleotidyltransferase family protein n=1 Tax=Chromobacterium amazonense TaxID=1382803 RepID=UPI000B33054D|nr:nucleotidyltransferase family protein [Chromobacterium amazonense]